MEAFALTKVKGNKKSHCSFPFHFLFNFFFIMETKVLGHQSSTSIGALILGWQWCTLKGWTLHNHVWIDASVEKGII